MTNRHRPVLSSDSPQASPSADDEPLLDAVRNGDRAAFGELYSRHRSAVFAVARMHSNSHAEAEDITSEAFTRVLALLQSGGGPRQFLRAYLITAVSRLAADRANDLNRARPHDPVEQGSLDRIQLFDDTVVRQVDSAVVARAFASLPERWQEVLWYLEIEGYRPRQVAAAIGVRPNAVSALGKRARDGLRTAYMQQHVSAHALEECGTYSARLGAFVRGTLTPSKTKQMQDHLDSCSSCTAEYLQLQDLGVGLRGWVLPVLAGLPLWSDVSDRLVTALTGAGVGGAGGVAAALDGSAVPPGSGAESTVGAASSTSANSGATAFGPVTPAETAPAGGPAPSGPRNAVTKVAVAGAVLAAVGVGTAAVVVAMDGGAPESETVQQARSAGDDTGEGGSANGAAGGGSDGNTKDSADDSASGESGRQAADEGASAFGALTAPGSESARSAQQAPEPLNGNGALQPGAPGSQNSVREDPSTPRWSASSGSSDTSQLQLPVTPVAPGPAPPPDASPGQSREFGETAPGDGPPQNGTTNDLGGGRVPSAPQEAEDQPGDVNTGTPGPEPSVTTDPAVPTPTPEPTSPPERPEPAEPVEPAPDPADPEQDPPVGPDVPWPPLLPELPDPDPEPDEPAVEPAEPPAPEDGPEGPVVDPAEPPAPEDDPDGPAVGPVEPPVPEREPEQPGPIPPGGIGGEDIEYPADPAELPDGWDQPPEGWTPADWIRFLVTGELPVNREP